MKTLKVVMEVFVDTYNRFGKAKLECRKRRKPDKESLELPFIIFGNKLCKCIDCNL